MHRLWIRGEWQDSSESKEIRSPYTGETIALASQATASQMEQALAASCEAFQKYKKISRFMRSRLLAAMVEGLVARRSELASGIMAEAGKPIALAEIEVSRAILTFTAAAEEAKRWSGEIIPLDSDASGRAYTPAVSQWVPRGPVLAIGPFNFP